MMERRMVRKMFATTFCTILRPERAYRRSFGRVRLLDDREDIFMSEYRLVYQHHQSSLNNSPLQRYKRQTPVD
jgi:hypothetical protein